MNHPNVQTPENCAISMTHVGQNSVVAKAPSNIALIKYMGKNCHTTNIPTNCSLSYTLDQYQSSVTVTENSMNEWAPLNQGFMLTPAEQQRFLKHVEYIKQFYGDQSPLLVQSQNNFPISCGLASSASSFAALSVATASYLFRKHQKKISTSSWQEWAQLSRIGSGSSCRSFFKPWVLWDNKTAQSISLPYQQLSHCVIMISHDKKPCSSSQAHKIVETSPLFKERPHRATQRLTALLAAIRQLDWQESQKLIQDEYLDMHQLFETANPRIQYRTQLGQQCEKWLHSYTSIHGQGPWVTMDAGPNIHLLFPSNLVASHCLKELRHTFPNLSILQTPEGAKAI